jgi:hypothetical protein
MEKTMSGQSREWKEGRRLRVRELKQLGWKQMDIVTALGMTPGAVSQRMTQAEKVSKGYSTAKYLVADRA